MIGDIPSALGNPGPACRAVVTLPPGPKRLTDDSELARFHIAPGGPRAPRFVGPVDVRQVRKILVVRLDFVGDWIVTTPLLDELRRLAPQAEITAVVIDRAYAFAESDPAVDRVVSIAKAAGRRVWFAAANNAVLSGFVADYVGSAFDLALVPRWDIDFNGALQIAHGSAAPRVIGFTERSTELKAIGNRGDDRFLTDIVDDRTVLHEAARQMTLLKALGRRDWTERPVRASFTKADELVAARIVRKFKKPIVVLAPFVDQGRRTLPMEHLVPTVNRLTKAFEIEIAIVAAPIHRERADALAKSLGTSTVSLAGRLSLRETAAVVARAKLLIGMDSGPAHIAAGVGTPVAVFSCHPADSPEVHPQAPERFAPRTSHGLSLVLRPATALSPCVNGCEQAEAHCITQLDLDTVWPRLRKFARKSLG